MTGWQQLGLTAGAAVAGWAAGRFLAPRIPPWRRMVFALLVLVVAVVLLVTLNNAMQWYPRAVFRLALMFGSFGWVLGMFGYRDPVQKGDPPEESGKRGESQE
ncbi:MAG: hypothetical protein HPY50_19550 [Firmicutes bacterium]|nr:hypothetical protein [Bacillota bacterium]